MPLVRLLLLCLSIVALAAQPSRAAGVCAMPSQTHAMPSQVHAMPSQAHAATATAGCDHATAPHRHRGCPGQMACCAPLAVRAVVPTFGAPHASRVLPPMRPLRERLREDAMRGSLLRPPRPV